MSVVKVPGLHKSTEILLNNAVDKDFQSILQPLNLVQKIYCMPKYRIRDNFITPNGINENIISFCGVVLFFFICFTNFTIESYSNNKRPKNLSLYISSLLNVTISAIGFIINFLANVVQSNNNVELVLRLQTSHRSMNYTTRDVKLLSFYIWIKIIILVFSTIFLGTYFHFYYPNSEIRDIIFVSIIVSFDMNMVYAISIMKLIANCMVNWHNEIKKENRITHTNIFVHSWDRKFDLYSNIMLAHKLFKKAFQHLILIHTVGTFLLALIYVQIIIEVAKINRVRDFSSIVLTLAKLFTWLLKNVTLQVGLGIESERFYIQVHEVDTTCIMAIASGECSGRSRKFYKNIMRVNQTSFNKLDTCGVFTVDAGSTLRLFGSIATYTIMLLQLAYL